MKKQRSEPGTDWREIVRREGADLMMYEWQLP